MTLKKTVTDYWFTIEPYVYVGLTKQCALLYNTLDGVFIESVKIEVIELLCEMLQKENYGVVLLTDKRYQNKSISAFIRELREKYMGDIIDINLSKGKPIQLLPFFNFLNPDKIEIYKKHNFYPETNVIKNLHEICIHVDHTINIAKLISFLQSVLGRVTFKIIGNMSDVKNYRELLSFFDQHPSPKNIVCSYINIIALQLTSKNNFSYRISVDFPINIQQWNHSRQILLSQSLPFEYVFEVSSFNDFLQANKLVEQYQIEKYHMNPVYTGKNIRFFEENVFLTRDDILSTSISIKDFFVKQFMNIHDFGKIHIMPNGDVYANVNHPVLGNIYTHSINEIVYKEIEKGTSWFRIRNQAPCNDCIYQWLCPPPSDYEILIGRPNLCHVK
jgi:pseudo-rSAM protein